MNTHIHTVCSEKNIGGNEIEEDLLPSFKKTVFMLIHKIEIRYNEDSQGYKKSIKSFMKSAQKVTSGNDITIQRALFKTLS